MENEQAQRRTMDADQPKMTEKQAQLVDKDMMPIYRLTIGVALCPDGECRPAVVLDKKTIPKGHISPEQIIHLLANGVITLLAEAQALGPGYSMGLQMKIMERVLENPDLSKIGTAFKRQEQAEIPLPKEGEDPDGQK